MTKYSQLISKYLARHAEPEHKCTQRVVSNFKNGAKYCVVIPAFKENDAFLSRLLRHPNSPELLIIVVINQPESQPYQANPLNVHLYNAIQELGHCTPLGDGATLVQHHRGTAFVAIDRFSEGLEIPSSAGVGLARKIGADIATALYAQHAFTHPVIFSTDADVELPNSYFIDQEASAPASSAWVYNYSHRNSLHGQGTSYPSTPLSQSDFAPNNIERATLAYEQAIKYYRDGLRWAGSPYAYHTLGSAISISIPHYCMVRGFPKRAAGEDFYLLNKLAKTGQVTSLDNTTITIDARLSDRVPFGTGPAVKSICDLWENSDQYRYYQPSCFVLLRLLLQCSPHLFELAFSNEYDPQNAKHQTQWEALDYQRMLERQLTEHVDQALPFFSPAQASKILSKALLSLNVNKLLLHTQQQGLNQNQFNRHFNEWFDGFMTLKFIRYLMANGFPHCPLADCIRFSDTHFKH